MPNAFLGNLVRIDQAEIRPREFFIVFAYAVFLRAWEKNDRGLIEMPDSYHGREGIEVGIGMTGDENAHALFLG